MIGELVIHYDNDAYRRHVPVWVELNSMQAEILDDGVGEYWEPDAPIGEDWDESWEAIDVDGKTYPAVCDWDVEGISYMEENYGAGEYIVIAS